MTRRMGPLLDASWIKDTTTFAFKEPQLSEWVDNDRLILDLSD